MFRQIVDDACALVSLGLFVSTIGLWLSLAGAA